VTAIIVPAGVRPGAPHLARSVRKGWDQARDTVWAESSLALVRVKLPLKILGRILDAAQRRRRSLELLAASRARRHARHTSNVLHNPNRTLWCSHHFSLLRQHMEQHIAGQRAAGRDNGDKASDRARWNCGFNERVRNDGELGGRSAKRDAGGSRKPLPEDRASLPNPARSLDESHERPESSVKAEDHAIIVAPAKIGCAIKQAVGALHEPAINECTVGASKVVQSGELADGSDFEDCPARVAAAG
jgi:hypothetical protein